MESTNTHRFLAAKSCSDQAGAVLHDDRCARRHGSSWREPPTEQVTGMLRLLGPRLRGRLGRGLWGRLRSKNRGKDLVEFFAILAKDLAVAVQDLAVTVQDSHNDVLPFFQLTHFVSHLAQSGPLWKKKNRVLESRQYAPVVQGTAPVEAWTIDGAIGQLRKNYVMGWPLGIIA